MKVYSKIKRAIKDMVKFTDEAEGPYNFVYRYGVVSSRKDEGLVLAWFHADTEEGLEGYIQILDRHYHKYSSTRKDREYDKGSDCWYCTYAVEYPFSTEDRCGRFDWQNAKPLF